jgi:hypothetical protein
MKRILEAFKMIDALEVGTLEILHPSSFPPLSRASNFKAMYNAVLFLLSARNMDDSAAKAQNTTPGSTYIHVHCVMNQNNLPMCNVQSESGVGK